MGHLHDSQGDPSHTRRKMVEINELMNETMKPDYDENIRHEILLNRKHKVGVSAFKFDELNGMISTDLPGRFPIKSA